MKRRTFIRTTGGIACLGVFGAQSVAATSHSTLVNAEVTASGAIVATNDDFVIAGQTVSVDGESFYSDGDDSYVIYNNGYSGEIYDNTLDVTSVSSGSGATFGVQADGGDVTVANNEIEGDDEVIGQFIGIGFSNGAAGYVAENEVTGAHRVGVLAVGADTNVAISDNTVDGPGPRTTGWADNGVQISGGATGSVKNNAIRNHWYAPNDYNSAGLLCFSDTVVVQRNDFVNNDIGVGLAGDRNNVIQNRVAVTYTETDTAHYGVWAQGGRNNGIRQNTVTTEAEENGLIGIIVQGRNAKLIHNELSGWDDPVLDFGDETTLPKPFEPTS